MKSEEMRRTMNLFDVYDYITKLERRIKKIELQLKRTRSKKR